MVRFNESLLEKSQKVRAFSPLYEESVQGLTHFIEKITTVYAPEPGMFDTNIERSTQSSRMSIQHILPYFEVVLISAERKEIHTTARSFRIFMPSLVCKVSLHCLLAIFIALPIVAFPSRFLN